MTRDNFYDNLFDVHPPFVIDGNFGYPSGVCEMLLQSHLGCIHLLPALPDAWPDGEVRGMRARGGFEIDFAWKAGRLTGAVIRSDKGKTCRLRTSAPVRVRRGVRDVKVDEADEGVISFPTEEGGKYRVTTF
jgi:alpha-L-fucosidase 2